jgi:hypothetical protein
MMNTESGTQLTESLAPQCLGANVRQLLQRPNGLKMNPVLLDTFTNIMKSHIYVLTSVVEHWIPAERDGGFVVDLQCDGANFLPLELS